MKFSYKTTRREVLDEDIPMSNERNIRKGPAYGRWALFKSTKNMEMNIIRHWAIVSPLCTDILLILLLSQSIPDSLMG